MARSSFGGSQDLSSLFASFYEQYQSRLEQNTQNADTRAKAAQTAADNDVIDRWQQGDMTDQEFLAYAAQRAQATADDPTQNAYWLKTQRSVEKSMLNDQITTTAQDLVDQVKAGTKTWNDVLAYYQQSQRSLKPSDPLYKDLAKQIEQVQGTIRDNQIAGSLEKVQYQFEAGQLTGKSAGAQLRQLAEVYRVNDSAKYYQILEQALSLEKYGGVYSSSGGGSGSGRGSSATPVNNLIDALQGMAQRIGSLSEQFNAGVQVGAITVENADGSLSNQQVLLHNPDGTPSGQMQQLDQQMLDTLSQLEQAHLAKGDRSAAGADANRRMQYITDQIQPRNTIAPQMQATSLLQTGLSLVEQAANSDDPTLGWAQVQAWASKVGDWESRLNKTVTQAPSGKQYTADQLRANPELKATQLTTSINQNPLEGQTTEAFLSQVAGLREFAQAVATGDSAAAASAFSNFVPADAAGGKDSLARVTAAIDLVTGIPEGKYVRAYVPGEGLVYAPVAPTYTTEIGPDGQPQTVLRSVPVNPNGTPLADASKGQELVDLMVQIGGKAQMVKGVSEQAYFVDGKPVSASDYQSALKASQGTGARAQQAAPQLREYRQLLVPGSDGTPQNWIYDDARQLWFKNTVTKYGGVPLPFVGKNAKLAQQVADQLGIDPQGTSYYNAKAEATKLQQHNQWGGTSLNDNAVRQQQHNDWYSSAASTARTEAQQQARDQTANAFRSATGMLGSTANVPIISQALKLFGAQLGVRSFDSPQPTTFPSLTSNTLPNLPTPTSALPKITLPKLPVTTQSKLTSLPLLDLGTTSAPAPAMTTTKIGTGRYTGKVIPT